MKRCSKPLSIRWKYLFSLIVLIIPCVIVPAVGTCFVSSSFIRSALALYKSELEHTTGTLSYLVDGMIGATNLILSDEGVKDILEGKDTFLYEFDKIQHMQDVFQHVEVSILYSYDINLVLMDMNGNVYDSKAYEYGSPSQYSTLLMQPFCQQLLTEGKKMQWVISSSGYSDTQTDRFFPGITLVRLITDSISKDTQGILILNVKQDPRLKRILFGSTQKDYMQLYVTDENGEAFISLASEPSHTLIDLSSSFFEIDQRTVFFQPEKTVYIKVPLKKLSGYVIGEIRCENLLKDYMDFTYFQIIINAIFLLIIFIIIYIQAGHITRPIIQLSHFLDLVSSGDYSKRIYLKGSLETENLSVHVNQMLDKTSQLLHSIEAATVEKERARLKILQAQLTPHFLLNTLNGIKWLCLSDQSNEAAQMIIALGRLLEISLNTDREFTTLQEEVGCLQNYVDLQRMRYGDFFRFELNIQEECNDVRVPIFILQPLVENCILHAFPEKKDDCNILVCAKMNDDNTIMFLSVQDNGIGIPDNWQMLSMKHNNREHIGLHNVVERLRFYYNLPNGFSISSSKPCGCTVAMKIPCHTNAEEFVQHSL